MNSNSIPLTTFINKIRCRYPGKIMDIFRIKRDHSPFIFVVLQSIGLEFYKPFRKFLTGIYTNFFPSRITGSNCSCGTNDISSRDIHGYIIGAEFSIEFALCMEWLIEPSIFIIDYNSRIPLSKIVLFSNSSCTFRKFSYMLYPVQINIHRFIRR